MSLKEQAIAGIGYSAFAQIGRQTISVLNLIVLAWFVTPMDFGVANLAVLVLGYTSLFADLGSKSAVIRRSEHSQELLSSLFWINTIGGIAWLGIICACSGTIANLLHEPRLAPMMQVLTFAYFLAGTNVLHQALLERDLVFGKLAKITLFGAIAGAAAAIITAYLGYGAWSLIYQIFALSFVETVFSWHYSKWRPSFAFYFEEVRQVAGYCINLSFSTGVNYLAKNLDSILIGIFLGTKALGYYTLACRIISYPLQSISGLVGRVMFPIYSRLQENNAKLQQSYIKTTESIAFIAFPVLLGLCAISEPLIVTMFGGPWRPAALILMLLVPVFMVQTITLTVDGLYCVKGRTDQMFGWGLANCLLLLLGQGLGLHWGSAGVAAAYAVVTVFILAYPTLAIPLKLISLPVRTLAIRICPPLFCSLLMWGLVLSTQRMLPSGMVRPVGLAILISLGGLSYLLASWVFNRDQLLEFHSVLGSRGESWQSLASSEDGDERKIDHESGGSSVFFGKLGTFGSIKPILQSGIPHGLARESTSNPKTLPDRADRS